MNPRRVTRGGGELVEYKKKKYWPTKSQKDTKKRFLPLEPNNNDFLQSSFIGSEMSKKL